MKRPDHIVYGGTFDPPHQGHIDCVRLAAHNFPDARISILPSPAPAGASGQHKKPATAFADRKAMLQIAMRPLLSPSVRIDDIEASLPAPNFTLQTLNALKQRAPTERMALLMGEDQLASFGRWREPLAILEIADVVVARRQGESYLGGDPWRSLESALGLTLEARPEGAFAPDVGAFLWVLDGEISPASSTEIRRALRAGQPVPTDWLPMELARWITEKQLYAQA